MSSIKNISPRKATVAHTHIHHRSRLSVTSFVKGQASFFLHLLTDSEFHWDKNDINIRKETFDQAVTEKNHFHSQPKVLRHFAVVPLYPIDHYQINNTDVPMSPNEDEPRVKSKARLMLFCCVGRYHLFPPLPKVLNQKNRPVPAVRCRRRRRHRHASTPFRVLGSGAVRKRFATAFHTWQAGTGLCVPGA